MMDLGAVRALYDQQERIDNADAGVRIIATPHTVRLLADDIGQGAVIYSRLDADNVEAAIEEEIVFFAAQPGITKFEWKVFDYDTPRDLLDRVKARGFIAEEPDAVCVLDLESLPDRLHRPAVHDIRHITDLSGIDDVLAVQRIVWGSVQGWEDEDWMRIMLEGILRDFPETIAIYVAYVQDVPVCSAWMSIHEGRAFAGLWGGSTVPEYRGQGIYTEMLAVRAQEAIRRGVRYLTIDASPMSRPIVEKHGFQFMAYAYACNYHLDTPP